MPVAMEMPYNVLNRGIEQDVVPACIEFGVGITCYSPLAEGLLTGRFSPGEASTSMQSRRKCRTNS